MTDEEYMSALAPLIEQTVSWANKRYDIWKTIGVDREDVESELWIVALTKRDLLEARLKDGQVGYVAVVLQHAAHDVLEPEWRHQKHAGPPLEKVEDGELRLRHPNESRIEAGKNPDPTPVTKIERKRFEDTFERMRLSRAAAGVVHALMSTLDATDAEILRLYLGHRISPDEDWILPGVSTPAIAREVGLGESTVRRRLANIREKAAELLREAESAED